MGKQTIDMKLRMWNDLCEKLKALKAEEIELRRDLFGAYFPTPNEGTNTAELANGWELKGTYKLDRKIDELELVKVSNIPWMKAVVNKVTKTKVLLDKRAYDKLDDKKRKTFDQCLTIKPAVPSLKLVAPRKDKS